MEKAASLCGVTHRYGEVIALDDVNLDIPAGRLVGLIGPDGVGKSTALALIAGVRSLQSGSATALDADLSRASARREICSRIAYMPQGLGRNLYPTLSVYENVDFFARLFGVEETERESLIAELLSGTGLAPFADRPAGKLSGGMKQKLGLCCSLVHTPELLILDEPTTGVDPLSRRQFWELLDRTRERSRSMSVIVATAYMEEAERFDHLVAMDAGRVLAAGNAESLRDQTGETSLEDAFISLLPAEKREGHERLVVPPRGNSNSRDIAIEAAGLTCRFGSFTAVDHVDVRIERGEIFGFLGSNGCGKTTTMKMLTGLLKASEGEASLFGRPVNPDDLETRKRVGFMSQAFSLYSELTVRQNLELHARLFHLPPEAIAGRVREMLERFGLAEYEAKRPDSLPLGIRQRLQLSVAVVHSPQMLILDEPTSGVDPVARDSFWKLLIDLSRNDGVTIFLSTHFMNEAERCDRISLMHAGKILAQGSPESLREERGARTLEEAFIGWLEEAEAQGKRSAARGTKAEGFRRPVAVGIERAAVPRFSFRRLWAYARREAMEIRRDSVRLGFALAGPLVIMLACGFGINFDVDRVPFAVLDYDRSSQSRDYALSLSSSKYFDERRPVAGQDEIERRLQSGELRAIIEIPPGFGSDLVAGKRPQVGIWIDGGNPSQADTSKNYIVSATNAYAQSFVDPESLRPAARVDYAARYKYNPDFRSVFAMVPGVVMLILILIPAILTAVGVVREKELGSIANVYSTPVTKIEFLAGKQLPYIALAMINFACCALMAVFLFRVPIKGGLSALVLGAAAFAAASTGFGLLVSVFAKTQVSALFAVGILTTLASISFSGWLTPLSSITGAGRFISKVFPSTYFEAVSIGAFTKSLGLADLAGDIAVLAAISAAYLGLSTALLRKQER